MIAAPKSLKLKEGERVQVTVQVLTKRTQKGQGLDATAGAWSDLFDDWDAVEQEMSDLRHAPGKPIRL